VTTLHAALRRIHEDLKELGVGHALIGGLAVSARTEPRFTRDADLAVAVVDDAAAESLLYQLKPRGYDIQTVVEQDAVGRLATARLTLQAPGPVIDLLFASSGIEPEVVAAAERLDLLEAVTLPVSRTGHLIALKVLSRHDVERPQDVGDLRALLRTATPPDLELARRAVELIMVRGYHRGRDLVSELTALLPPTR
jgi:hypothetical protein